MKKAIRRLAAVLFTLSIPVLTGITLLERSMPEQFSVIEGSELTLHGMVKAETAAVGTGGVMKTTSQAVGSSYPASLKLFGVFPIKDITVKVVDVTSVIPCGTPFGLKMFTDGVVVVGMSDIDTASGPKSPARSAGIKLGDVIVSINGETVNTNEQVASIIEKSAEKSMVFRIRRNNIQFDVVFNAEKSVNENRYKAGLWVRDSSAGIGTMTFYVPGANIFGGLGHAICDVDTGEILPLSSGEVVPAKIYSIVKGEKGQPGELRGGFDLGSLGSLGINGETGVYGTLIKTPTVCEPVQVAMKQQVHEGYAQLLTTLDGDGPRLYDIEIDQVKYNDSSPTRNMVIVIRDKELLEKTGGIVQGMSGSPILQDGKLVGAVTHVFVNDPTKGFAIFAENMLKTANTVKSSEKAPAA